jgi:predicted nucleotidyltransferase/DNA-binding HxlR family transcriptional regulator
MNEAMMIELFGGTNRYKVLRKLYERPTERHHLRALAALTGISSGTLHTTLRRLERAGLVRRIAGKPLVFYQAPVDDTRLAPLLDLFRGEGELVADLRAALEPFARQVRYAGLFGSYARGEDRADSDVDVLVVGPGNSIKVQAALAPVARKHRRPVNAAVFSDRTFAKMARARDPFFEEIAAGRRVDLLGSWDAAASQR